VKDGIPHHVPTLMRRVKEMVTKEPTTRSRATAPDLP